MPILITVGWIVAWVLLWRLPALGEVPVAPAPESAPEFGGSPDSTDLSSVAKTPVIPPLGEPAAHFSVVIPARNEKDRLPLLLRSLEFQSVRPLQVIVVDDASDDATAACARAFDGVDVISADPLPEGWTGKSWACASGAEHAIGDSLVFLDADVQLAPNALAAVAEELSRHGGLVSVQPRHYIESPIEAASMPFNIVGIMGLGIGSIIPPRRQWGATGPCIATSRHDYRITGGHAATSGAVAEDLELAALYNSAGLPVHCLSGGERIRFRMYRDLHEIVAGWSKNIMSGAQRTPLPRALGIALWITAMLQSTGLILRICSTGSNHLVLAGVVYVAFTIQWFGLGRQVGRFGAAALLWPVLNLFFVGVVLVSAFQTVFLRRVQWSGRRIEVGRR